MYLILVFLLFPLFISGEKTCFPCQCIDPDQNGNFKADCGYSTINKYVSDIVPTIPSDIEVLWFNGQRFKFLKADTFATFNNLKMIWFPTNNIETIEKNTFKHLTLLEDLSLYQNKIKNLPDGIFSDIYEVNKISLSHNSITRLQTHLFSNLTKLENIYLEWNNIHEISENCFYNLSSLRFILLDHNNLKTLHPDIINDNNQLKLLTLHENPWHCNKKLCSITDFVSLKTVNELRCKAPLELENHTWTDVLNKLSTPTIYNDDYYAQIGETIQLECHFCMASKIIWKFNHNSLWRDSNTVTRNSISILILYNVSAEDQGTYSCHTNYCNTCKSDETTLTIHESVLYSSNMKEKGSVFIYLIVGGIVSTLLIAVGAYLVYRLKYSPQEQDELGSVSFLNGPDPTPFTPPDPENDKTKRQTRISREKKQEIPKTNKTEENNETSNSSSTRNQEMSNNDNLNEKEVLNLLPIQ